MEATIVFWLANFLPVAFLLAIFEIWLEEKHKEGPWGKTYFKNPYWEKQVWLPIPFLAYLSRYHIVMFLVVMPVAFAGSMTAWCHILSYSLIAPDKTWYLNLGSVATMFLAIWFGNAGMEDFLYFLIQSLTGWHEPHALRKVVVEKDMAWFKDWLPPVLGLNIPGHWLFCPAISLVLLAVHRFMITGHFI